MTCQMTIRRGTRKATYTQGYIYKKLKNLAKQYLISNWITRFLHNITEYQIPFVFAEVQFCFLSYLQKHILKFMSMICQLTLPGIFWGVLNFGDCYIQNSVFVLSNFLLLWWTFLNEKTNLKFPKRKLLKCHSKPNDWPVRMSFFCANIFVICEIWIYGK